MKGIIILLTEEEFQARLDAAVKNALENFTPQIVQFEYLTRKKVSARLHISLPTLNEYTKTGKLKAYRINGRVLYRENEIDAALTSVESLKYKRS